MIICKNCGAELPDHAKFCTKCGYAIIPDEEIPREPLEAQAAAEDWNVQAQQADASYNPYPAAPQYQDSQYQQQYQQPQQYQQQPQYYGGYQENAYGGYRDQNQVDQAAKNNEGKGPMIMAIIGLVLYSLGVPGIILCAIAKSKVKAWEEKYGPATGMAKAAKIIATIGLVLSIIMTVCWAIIFIAGLASGDGFFDILEEVFEDMFDIF